MRREKKGGSVNKQTTLQNLLTDAEALSYALASATDENLISQEIYDEQLNQPLTELIDNLYFLIQNN